MRGCRSVGVGKSPDPGNASRQLQDTPIVDLVQHRSPNFDPCVWLRGPVNPIYREGRGEAIWFPRCARRGGRFGGIAGRPCKMGMQRLRALGGLKKGREGAISDAATPVTPPAAPAAGRTERPVMDAILKSFPTNAMSEH